MDLILLIYTANENNKMKFLRHISDSAIYKFYFCVSANIKIKIIKVHVPVHVWI